MKKVPKDKIVTVITRAAVAPEIEKFLATIVQVTKQDLDSTQDDEVDNYLILKENNKAITYHEYKFGDDTTIRFLTSVSVYPNLMKSSNTNYVDIFQNIVQICDNWEYVLVGEHPLVPIKSIKDYQAKDKDNSFF